MSDLSFLHVGDVHIGKSRLKGRFPSKDFSDAFEIAVDSAIKKKVDFLLVAGDFFDCARIEPDHLVEAMIGLERLKSFGIPIVAIEGNHDVVSSYEDRPSWLSYLNRVGLVRLLRTEFKNGKPQMKEWTEKDPAGNFMDIAGARIYGAGWFGASTARRLELLVPEIEKKGFTILMLHAGINGMAEEFGMLDEDQLAVSKGAVDLVVLGHMHKKYVVDGYAYNAGAMECWDLGEEKYGVDKGYWTYRVKNGKVDAEHTTVKRRPIHLHEFNTDGIKSSEALLEAITKEAGKWSLSGETAVRLRLTGSPKFSPSGVDLGEIENKIEEVANCKAVEVIPAFSIKVESGEEGEGFEIPREAIERQEIEKLVADTGRYPDDAETVREMVNLVLNGGDNEDLYSELLSKAGVILDGKNAD